MAASDLPAAVGPTTTIDFLDGFVIQYNCSTFPIEEQRGGVAVYITHNRQKIDRISRERGTKVPFVLEEKAGDPWVDVLVTIKDSSVSPLEVNLSGEYALVGTGTLRPRITVCFGTYRETIVLPYPKSKPVYLRIRDYSGRVSRTRVFSFKDASLYERARG